MAENIFKKIGKNASDTAKKLAGAAKEASDGVKKTFEELPADANAAAFHFKEERKRAPLRAKALSALKDAMNAIDIQRSNEEVTRLTEEIVSEIKELEHLLKVMAPADIAERCEELLEKYSGSKIPEVEEGALDARARDNEKIERIYRKANQLFNQVGEIMSQ